VSVPVSLDRLRAEIANYRVGPYLLTVSDDQAPHCVAVAVEWVDDELVMGAGNRTRGNATARPTVTLLWPPTTPDGYSLIVDAAVTATSGTGNGDNAITVRPSRAVMHRPAAPTGSSDGGCGSDCVPLSPD
jgi:hypothetical protein